MTLISIVHLFAIILVAPARVYEKIPRREKFRRGKQVFETFPCSSGRYYTNSDKGRKTKRHFARRTNDSYDRFYESEGRAGLFGFSKGGETLFRRIVKTRWHRCPPCKSRIHNYSRTKHHVIDVSRDIGKFSRTILKRTRVSVCVCKSTHERERLDRSSREGG